MMCIKPWAFGIKLIRNQRNFDMYLLKKIVNPLALLILCFTVFAPEVKAEKGEAMFRQYCGICHTIGKGRLVGPDLNGVTSNRSEAWLMKWTKDSQGLIKSGDPDAKAVFALYNNVIMPNPNLPDADIKTIFEFIASKSALEASAKEIVADESGNSASFQFKINWNNPLNYLFLLVFIVIFLSLGIILRANRILKKEEIKTTHFILNNNFGGLTKWLSTYQIHLGIQLFVLVLLGIICALTIGLH